MRFFSRSQSKRGSSHGKLLKSPKYLPSKEEESAIKSLIPTAIGYESDDSAEEDDIRKSRSRYDIEQRDDNALGDDDIDKYGNSGMPLSLENSFSGDLLWRPIVDPIGNEDPYAIDPNDDDWCSGGDSSHYEEHSISELRVATERQEKRDESPSPVKLSRPPEPQISPTKSNKYKAMMGMSKKDAQRMNSLGDQSETDNEIDESGSSSSGSTASGSGKVARSAGTAAAATAAVGAAVVASKMEAKPSPVNIASEATPVEPSTKSATTTSKAARRPRSRLFGCKNGSQKKAATIAAPAQTKTATTAVDTNADSTSSKTVPTKTANEAKEKKVAAVVATKNPPASSTATAKETPTAAATTLGTDGTTKSTGVFKLNRRPSLKERLASALTKKPSFKESAALAAANFVAAEKANAIPTVVTTKEIRDVAPRAANTSVDESFDALLDADTKTNNTEKTPTPAVSSPSRRGESAVHDFFDSIEDFLKPLSFGGNAPADLDNSTNGSTANNERTVVDAPESNTFVTCLRTSVVCNPVADCIDNGVTKLDNLQCDEGLADPFTGEEKKVTTAVAVSSRSLALDEDNADAIAAKERAAKAREVIPIKSIEFHHTPPGSETGVSPTTGDRKERRANKLAVDTELSEEPKAPERLKNSPSSKLFGLLRRRGSQKA